VARPIRVAIDLRPLARGPSTGIGLILTQILEELTPRGFRFIGVSDRRLDGVPISESIEVRASKTGGGRIRWEHRELPEMLRAIDPAPDLYHATWNHGVPPGLPYPSLLSLHDLIPWVAPRFVPWPKPGFLHRWLYRRAVRASSRAAALIVTLSEASRRDIVARLPETSSRIEVVPCAVPRWLAPAPPGASGAWRARFGGAYILYFGGFDPRKGVDLLVDAMAGAFPEAALAPPLVLAGVVNRLARDAARSAKELGFTAHLPGYIPDRELAALLGGASLFVYPSRYEGFGIPPLLALAAGTPCVASDAPAVREVVGDAALLFSSGDAASLARLLAAAARDPAALAALGPKGRERAARFSVDSFAERMTRVYERVAGSRPGSA
jgi:glycosyltransferase involved in cell wall biosynthesis